MAIDYSKIAFISTLKYMRKYNDYTLPSGGGTVLHNLGYAPYFIPLALESGDDYLIQIRTGNVYFPSGDIPFYLVEATNTTIRVVEDIPPLNATTYIIRVYEDPLP